MSSITAPGARTELWLPLLRTLTEECPGWLLWKNAESAFTGVGDIDAAAPVAEWPVVERCFREWAEEQGVGPVIVCRHIPGGLNLVAVPSDSTTLLEMGVKNDKIWRGSQLFEYDDLRPLAGMDPRGFRRLRPGAEGFFKLMLNGSRWDGRPDDEGLRAKHVATLLRQDPEGARMAAKTFGPAARAAVAAAEGVASGDWNRGAMLVVTAWAALRTLRRPKVLAKRVEFRLLAKKRCPVVAALLGDERRSPADRNAWLRQVAATHEVYSNTAAQT